MKGCGWMCSMRLRPPKARRSRRRTARALCGGWHQGNRRTRTTSPIVPLPNAGPTWRRKGRT
eukprot:2258536-Prymnesium_polylepis.1